MIIFYSRILFRNNLIIPATGRFSLYNGILSIVITKIFRRKDITLTRNCVIQISIQNTLVPPIAGYF